MGDKKYFDVHLAIEEASRCLLCYDAPCSKACPAKTDPARFIQALRFKNLKGGARTIRENNIFGGLCAEVCEAEKYCQKVCIRAKIDRPLNIPALQGFLLQNEQAADLNYLKIREPVNQRVAVIGSGISAYTAAARLSIHGIKVSLFSKAHSDEQLLNFKAEGKLSAGVLQSELELIKSLGVEFNHDTGFSGNDFEAIKAKGFDAVLITSKGRGLPLNTAMKSTYETDIKGVFVSGVLVKGPDDIVFSVKKGKDAAEKVLQFLNTQFSEGEEEAI